MLPKRQKIILNIFSCYRTNCCTNFYHGAETQEFTSTVSRALCGQVGDKLSLPPPSLSLPPCVDQELPGDTAGSPLVLLHHRHPGPARSQTHSRSRSLRPPACQFNYHLFLFCFASSFSVHSCPNCQFSLTSCRCTTSHFRFVSALASGIHAGLSNCDAIPRM